MLLLQSFSSSLSSSISLLRVQVLIDFFGHMDRLFFWNVPVSWSNSFSGMHSSSAFYLLCIFSSFSVVVTVFLMIIFCSLIIFKWGEFLSRPAFFLNLWLGSKGQWARAGDGFNSGLNLRPLSYPKHWVLRLRTQYPSGSGDSLLPWRGARHRFAFPLLWMSLVLFFYFICHFKNQLYWGIIYTR